MGNLFGDAHMGVVAMERSDIDRLFNRAQFPTPPKK